MRRRASGGGGVSTSAPGRPHSAGSPSFPRSILKPPEGRILPLVPSAEARLHAHSPRQYKRARTRAARNSFGVPCFSIDIRQEARPMPMSRYATQLVAAVDDLSQRRHKTESHRHTSQYIWAPCCHMFKWVTHYTGLEKYTANKKFPPQNWACLRLATMDGSSQ